MAERLEILKEKRARLGESRDIPASYLAALDEEIARLDPPREVGAPKKKKK